MKRILFILAVALAVPLAHTGCQSTVTLAPGGVYTDPVLAVTDQSILDASHALTGFLDWTALNHEFLSQYPEVGKLSTQIAQQKDGWIRDAYAARDAYASASHAYRSAAGGGDPTAMSTTKAKLDLALAVLTNLTDQIVQYRLAHPAK